MFIWRKQRAKIVQMNSQDFYFFDNKEKVLIAFFVLFRIFRKTTETICNEAKQKY
jgi:hypothetical protein